MLGRFMSDKRRGGEWRGTRMKNFARRLDESSTSTITSDAWVAKLRNNGKKVRRNDPTDLFVPMIGDSIMSHLLLAAPSCHRNTHFGPLLFCEFRSARLTKISKNIFEDQYLIFHHNNE
jgi:hypothetical protein